MPKGLLTTTVGSFPKPDYITGARAKASRGELSPDELLRLERQAVEHWVRLQEQLDIDILVDGEMYRGDMVTYFSEHLEGFAISGLVRSYGNRYYRKPIAVGPVARKSDITVRRCDQPNPVDGKSVMKIMMLAATQGTKIEITAQGCDAVEAVQTLVALVESGFREE